MNWNRKNSAVISLVLKVFFLSLILLSVIHVWRKSEIAFFEELHVFRSSESKNDFLSVVKSVANITQKQIKTGSSNLAF